MGHRPSKHASGDAHAQSVGKTPRHVLLIGLAIACLTFLTYSRILFNGFVAYDDPLYVTGNAQVQAGVSLQGLRYVVTDTSTGNWHPVTMLGHMINTTIFGLVPEGHHFVGLLLHAANTFLVCFVLYRMTKSVVPSAIAALLFGIHPLHVASVAHIAQLKDLLSTLFMLLTILAYSRYAQTGRKGAFYASIAWFTVGLLAKSMLVTMPVVLLILDYWPLRRLETGERPARRIISLLREKIPFFVLAIIVSIVTFLAQRASGAVAPLDIRPFGLRIENALVSYVMYMVKTVWPANLAVFYPFPQSIPAWNVIAASIVLTLLTGLALAVRRRMPYFTAGWFWYLVTLLPVIGIVQLGAQSMADRYSYVPLIGIFVAFVWAGYALVSLAPRWRMPIMAITVVTVCALAGKSWVQAGTWQDTRVLWQHAIAVTDNNYIAHNNLGVALAEGGDLKGAERAFREAIEIFPEFTDAKLNLANVYNVYALRALEQGQFRDAAANFYKALDHQPTNSDFYLGIGNAQFAMRNYEDAAAAFAEAVRLAPSRVDARVNLGVAYEAAGDYSAAQRELTEAIRLEPDLAMAREAIERVRRKMAASPTLANP